MIVCTTCGKENQDHYKFCLGCGSDLPRAKGKEQHRPTPTPPAGIPALSAESDEPPKKAKPAPEPKKAQPVKVSAAPAPAAPVQPAKAGAAAVVAAPKAQKAQQAEDRTTCSSCGAAISPGFAFCGSCGTPIPGRQPAGAPQVAKFAKDSARLVLIQPDGTEGGQVEIPASEVAVGRDAGGFFSSDHFLSPRHAILRTDGKEVVVKDENSLNGVFLKMDANEPVKIKSGDIFRLGQEMVLFEEIDLGSSVPDGTERMGSPTDGLWGRVALIVGRDRLGNAFPIGGEGVVFGRERGDILFPEDGYVSGMHLKIYREKNKFFLCDLGSSNGTFLKMTDETRLSPGSFLLMGQQLFRVDL